MSWLSLSLISFCFFLVNLAISVDGLLKYLSAKLIISYWRGEKYAVTTSPLSVKPSPKPALEPLTCVHDPSILSLGHFMKNIPLNAAFFVFCSDLIWHFFPPDEFDLPTWTVLLIAIVEPQYFSPDVAWPKK